MYKHNQLSLEVQVQAQLISDLCYTFLKPLLNQLNQALDRRLVCTFLQTILVLLAHRRRNPPA